ncbi:MAG: hypothetical protein ACYST9_04305 [Planctomycetota bacterium]|jgi:hypothetical protein
MEKKRNGMYVKIGILTVLAMTLFVSSCKKAPQEEVPAKEATKTEAKPAEVEKQETVPTKAATGELVPIDIKLPKPMFVGTPQNIKVANLEKPLGKARPPFYAPAGVKNLSFEKPIIASDPEPIIGEVELITDGDKDAMDGSYVEFGPFLQHVTIDLEAQYEIYAAVLWHYHKQARVYYDVIVQIADDADFTTNVNTIYNNDIDNSAGLGIGTDMHYVETSEGRLIDAKGHKGRYIRFYSQGNSNDDFNHYIEVEVFGK